MPDMLPCHDQDDPRNGSEYWTGKECIENGCHAPAGTAWSPLWCFDHNSERIRRIDEQFDRIGQGFGAGHND